MGSYPVEKLNDLWGEIRLSGTARQITIVQE
ncbi:hypothetical protein M2310_003165 [Rhizobium leguminosarum]|uniref:Uncharacterized protein n=1 Tax=Rhizobium esperanzae TaxID=1967781 RepID=A0A7W6UKL6_9HYPH|nr:hypothetical protein [Rhizobium esperanzae]MDH6202484.1 hypothetical protein [Rhizobium leguminosarum]